MNIEIKRKEHKITLFKSHRVKEQAEGFDEQKREHQVVRLEDSLSAMSGSNMHNTVIERTVVLLKISRCSLQNQEPHDSKSHVDDRQDEEEGG